jgi:hypothetical protein
MSSSMYIDIRPDEYSRPLFLLHSSFPLLSVLNNFTLLMVVDKSFT